MNELLLSEVTSDEKSLLQSLVLIEEFIFNQSIEQPNDVFKSIIEQCSEAIEHLDEPLEKAEHLINELYVGHLLLDIQRRSWPVSSFQCQKSFEHRVIAPVLKAVVLCHIIEACGFDCDVVFVPEQLMVRIECDETYSIIFDPVSGESLSWYELDNRLDELEGDPSEYHLPSVETKTVVLEYLSTLKNALIKELMFDKALKCVDILLALRPNDPFERRDRGFLLHQLDCFKVAYDDYRYFVENCPKDPAAQLLKMQLDQISLTETVLH